MNPFEQMALIGDGRVGEALWLALDGSACRPGWVWSPVKPERSLGSRHLYGKDALPMEAKAWLICVPDHALRWVADVLSDQEVEVAIHVSGAHPSSLLQSEGFRGEVASMHPLSAIPSVADAGREGALQAVREIAFSLEGDPGACALAREIIARCDGDEIVIEREAKALYHAGAVLASNDIVALLAHAIALWEQAGISGEVATRLLAALARGSLENVAKLGARGALTGPVQRLDYVTLQGHLDALKEAGMTESLALYESVLFATSSWYHQLSKEEVLEGLERSSTSRNR